MKRSKLPLRPWRRTGSCPTCGGRQFLRLRRGGIARIVQDTTVPFGRRDRPPADATPEDRRAFYKAQHERRQAERSGRGSMRVYWPRVKGYTRSPLVSCPDPFHDRTPYPPEPERFTTVNVHARPARLSARRQAKESRHRERQGKDRR